MVDCVIEPLPFEPNYNLADVIDVIAALDDPNGAAAERVRFATDPTYAIGYFHKLMARSFAVPREFLGGP